MGDAPSSADASSPAPDAEAAFGDTYGAGYDESVAYNGQVFRLTLIEALKGWIGDLGGIIDADAAGSFDESEEVVASLLFYADFDADSNGGEPIGIETEPPLLQQTWEELPSTPSLRGKIAGNDTVTDHRDWNEGAFAGWDDISALAADEVSTPTQLLEAFFATLGENAAARAQGNQPRPDEALLPAGASLPVYVTADGLDLQQLVEKFLLMAIAFSQGTDDYLGDDVEDKGLRASNAVPEGEAYSGLAHAWDEGFGYFGAARDYSEYTDEEVAGSGGRDDWQGHHDSDGDGRIDLLRERNRSASVNAAKRDRDAVEPTDFSGAAFSALLAGRQLIAAAGAELTEAEKVELRGHRDVAVAAWEGAIAATVVHYINAVLADMDAFGSEDYDFADHAKHWSEMKGFAVGFQFNPRSPLLADHPTEDASLFEALHARMGGRPVLPNAPEAAAYREQLLESRDLLGDAYGFADANLEAW